MARIFISHASRDNTIATEIGAWLDAQGWGPVFLDIDLKGGLQAGDEWRSRLHTAIDASVAVICIVTDAWLASEECWKEYRRARSSQTVGAGERKFIIPILVGDIDPATLGEGLSDYQVIRCRTWTAESCEPVSERLSRAGLSPDHFRVNPHDTPDYTVFRGLVALDIPDAAIFFGRDAEIAAGLRAIAAARTSQGRQQIVTLRGSSGSGKSSLMHAGILARLERNHHDYIVLPSIRVLPLALSQAPTSDNGRRGLVPSLRTALKAVGLDEEALLAQLLETRAPAVFSKILAKLRRGHDALYGAVSLPRLIVLPIDQAEEALSDSEECKALLRLLEGGLQADHAFALLISMRSSDHAGLNAIAPFNREEILLKIEPVSTEHLGQLIEGPASVAEPPIAIDAALLPTIISDLTNGRNTGISGDTLPLLALTLNRMVDKASDALTLVRYNAVGRVTGILQNLLSGVMADTGRSEDDLLAVLVPDFIALGRNGEYVRRQVRLSTLSQETIQVLEQLVHAQIVRKAQIDSDNLTETVVELFHESVARLWPALHARVEALREDLQAVERLESSAALWLKDVNDTIYRGRALSDALKIVAKPQFATYISDDAQAFLQTSVARRNAFRTRVATIAAGVSIVLFVLFTLINDTSTRRWAEEQIKGKSMPEARFALAAGYKGGSILGMFAPKTKCDVGDMAKPSDCLLRLSGTVEPVTVLKMPHGTLKPIDGAVVSPDNTAVVTFVKRWAVYSTLDRKRKVETLVFPREVSAVTMLPGNELVAGTEDGRIFFATPGQGTRQHSDLGFRITRILQSTDGTLYAFSSDGNITALTRAGVNSKFRAVPASTTIEAAFVSESHNALVTFGGGRIAVIDRFTGAERWKRLGSGIPHGTITDDGRLIVFATANGALQVRTLENGHVANFTQHTRSISFVAGAPAGDMVISADKGNEIWVWHARTGLLIAGPLEAKQPVVGAAFAPDGNHILTSTDDGAVHYWDLSRGKEISRIGGFAQRPLAAKFLSGGKEAVVVSDHGVIQVRRFEELGQGARLRRRVCGTELARHGLVGTFNEDELASHPGPLRPSKYPCNGKGLLFWLG